MAIRTTRRIWRVTGWAHPTLGRVQLEREDRSEAEALYRRLLQHGFRRVSLMAEVVS